MNKRIRELATQAGITDNNLSDGDMSRIDLEKFAELIVKECAHVALMSNGNNLHVFTLIKEHFGVEE
jgi:hypothetical protein